MRTYIMALSVTLFASALYAAEPGGRGRGMQRRERRHQSWSATQPASDTQPAARGCMGKSAGPWACCQAGAQRSRGAGNCCMQGRGLGGHGYMGGRRQEAGPSSQPAATLQPAMGRGHSPRVGRAAHAETGGGMHGMSDAEHELIQRLVMNHKTIIRTVRDISGGVETVTTTSDPELVAVLREHVRRMAARLSAGRPVRQWDPVFRDVFRHAEDISTEIKDTPGGLTVTQTTEKPEVVAIIRAHARAVSNFAEQGAVAVRPPWAGRGRS